MGFFTSFEDKVEEAISQVIAKVPGINGLRAEIEDKTVTLNGQVENIATKGQVSSLFNELVETDNTFNRMTVLNKPASASPASAMGAAPVEAEAAPEPQETIHEVVPGDTLGAIAQKYYGKASQYPKIFEANRDILDDPNMIKVGQKLRIPSLST